MCASNAGECGACDLMSTAAGSGEQAAFFIPVLLVLLVPSAPIGVVVGIFFVDGLSAEVGAAARPSIADALEAQRFVVVDRAACGGGGGGSSSNELRPVTPSCSHCGCRLIRWRESSSSSKAGARTGEMLDSFGEALYRANNAETYRTSLRSGYRARVDCSAMAFINEDSRPTTTRQSRELDERPMTTSRPATHTSIAPSSAPPAPHDARRPAKLTGACIRSR